MQMPRITVFALALLLPAAAPRAMLVDLTVVADTPLLFEGFATYTGPANQGPLFFPLSAPFPDNNWSIWIELFDGDFDPPGPVIVHNDVFVNVRHVARPHPEDTESGALAGAIFNLLPFAGPVIPAAVFAEDHPQGSHRDILQLRADPFGPVALTRVSVRVQHGGPVDPLSAPLQTRDEELPPDLPEPSSLALVLAPLLMLSARRYGRWWCRRARAGRGATG